MLWVLSQKKASVRNDTQVPVTFYYTRHYTVKKKNWANLKILGNQL